MTSDNEQFTAAALITNITITRYTTATKILTDMKHHSKTVE